MLKIKQSFQMIMSKKNVSSSKLYLNPVKSDGKGDEKKKKDISKKIMKLKFINGFSFFSCRMRK